MGGRGLKSGIKKSFVNEMIRNKLTLAKIIIKTQEQQQKQHKTKQENNNNIMNMES